jgi:hypothetical protein
MEAAHDRGMSTHRPSDTLLVLDGFLSAPECDQILNELDYAFWRPSLTYQRQSDDTYKNVLADTRVSDTAHHDMFPDGLIELLATVESRLEASFDAPRATLEWWQATRYPVDGKFDYHLDAGYWEDHHAGDRVRTFLLFLTTPAAGGGTHFRALDVLVEAKAGRLLVWDNLFADGTPDHRMIHSGTPLREGRKVTLLTWQRQRRFRPAAAPTTGDGDP